MSDSSSLSIALIGAGGIGSAFAFYLARAGHRVTVLARPGSPRLAQLERDRAIVRVDDKSKSTERAEVSVGGALDEAVDYDLVLVTTLAHQVDAVLPSLKASKAKAVHFLFNNFEPERLRDALGADKCTFGMPFLMATVDAEGRLHSTINPGQKTLHSDARWVELFAGAGLPSTLEPDMLLWLRCHAPMGAAFESICHTAHQRRAGATWSEASTVARGLQGGLTLVKALGYRLYPAPKAFLAAAPTFVVATMLWSVSRIASFRELLATGVRECRALIDTMIAAGGTKAKDDASLASALQALAAMKPSDQ